MEVPRYPLKTMVIQITESVDKKSGASFANLVFLFILFSDPSYHLTNSISNLMKIRTKLVLAFLSVGVTPLIILSILSIRTTGLELETQALNMVETISDHKRSAIENYFTTCEGQVVTFSNNRTVVDYLEKIDQASAKIIEQNSYTDGQIDEMRNHLKSYYVNDFGRKYKSKNGKNANISKILSGLDDTAIAMQYLYISKNEHPLGSKENLDNAGDQSEYSEIHEHIHPSVRQYLRQFGYYDIFLINPEGRLVYSVYKELDYGTSLLDGPYDNTNFAEAFKQALQAGRSGDRDSVFLVDFETYTPSYEAPASFAASPVIDNGECVGVAIMQMPLDRLSAVMKNDAGLGETGDSYIVGSDYLMRSDSLKMNDFSIAESFKKNKQVKNDMLEVAISGKKVSQTLKNLKGEIAFASYLPVSVGDSQWVVVNEIERKEALGILSDIKLFVIILSTICAVLVTFASILVSSSIIRPIRKLISTLKIFNTDGDLTKRLEINKKDEFGELTNCFNNFMDKLNGIIITLSENAKNLGKASEQLEKSSNDMSKNTSGMDGQITNVAAAGEELSVNIQSMSQGADQISSSAREVSKSVNDLRNSIQEVAKNCNEGAKIAEEANVKTQDTSDDIHELGKVAQEIEGVVDLIRNVAGQTNLLALNASIEAASAGDAGQGFAVVANEVKELAQQTTDATREIEGKISQIRDRIQVSIESITEVSKVIQNVNTISVDISETMEKQSLTTNEISNAVKEVSDSSDLLAKNVEESAGGANEIAKNISGVSQSAKISTQGANETNKQSKKLADTTNTLKDIVGQFKY